LVLGSPVHSGLDWAIVSSFVPYTVENIPWYLKPGFWLFGYGLGFLFYLFVRCLSFTCRIEMRGEENLRTSPNHIFAMWHQENLPAFVVSLFRRLGGRFVMLNHPMWYMKPVHFALDRLGVEKLVLGSTGHGGRKAADQLVEFLREGWSTHINPDGPAGPPKALKKGVLHLALQSGVPIIAVKIEVQSERVLRSSWDGKRLPLPFTRITILLERPLVVTPGNFEASAARLAKALG
jgi:lysophospholipid acyltransferase (LPLAT)-like uncharacterized protein